MNLVLEKTVANLSHDFDWPSAIEASLHGDLNALEGLLKELQPHVYNFALRMVLAPDDAEDVTQEVLLKVTLNLAKYDASKAKFTTWVYAILRNHVIDMKPKKLEAVTESFSQYGAELEKIPDKPFGFGDPVTTLLVKEANAGCLLGMLLCLEREQRFVYILGEVMRIPDTTGAEICDTSAVNFRKRLSRARQELYNFMNDRCGLINKENPCRCHKKTRGFIAAGWVNPDRIQFANDVYQNARIFSEERADEMCDLTEEYGNLFRRLPAYDSDRRLLEVRRLLENREFREVFAL